MAWFILFVRGVSFMGMPESLNTVIGVWFPYAIFYIVLSLFVDRALGKTKYGIYLLCIFVLTIHVALIKIPIPENKVLIEWVVAYLIWFVPAISLYLGYMLKTQLTKP